MTEPCTRPPEGWYCTRGAHEEGPCAAVPDEVQVQPTRTIARTLIAVLGLIALCAVLFGCGPATPPAAERWIGVVLTPRGDTIGTHQGERCWLEQGAVKVYGYDHFLPEFQQQVPRDGTGVCLRLP